MRRKFAAQDFDPGVKLRRPVGQLETVGAIGPKDPEDGIDKDRRVVGEKEGFDEAGVVAVVIFHHRQIARDHIIDIRAGAHAAIHLCRQSFAFL